MRPPRALPAAHFDRNESYVISRTGHLGRLESEFEDLERLVRERELPRDILQAVLHLSRHQKGIGLSETELRVRLNRLQELHFLPEHRVQPGINSDGQVETSSS